MSSTRKAGFNELRCISRNVLGLYGTIVTLGTYSSPSTSESQLKASVISAVKECISIHGALSAVLISPETEAPQVARVREINLDKHVVWSTSASTTDFVPLLRKVHNEPVVDFTTIPQWRLYIVQTPASSTSTVRFHAVLATSHNLADGMSHTAFHNTFLHALRTSSPTTSTTSTFAVAPEETLLPPALDKAAHFPISWKYFLSTIAGEVLPKPVARLIGVDQSVDGAWVGPANRPALPAEGTLLETEIDVVMVPPQTLSRALAAGKKEKARLTGLLNVVTTRALAEALQKRGTTSRIFTVETAIDLRKNIPVGQNAMANYASGIDETVTVDESGKVSSADWEAARRFTDRLAAASSTLADQQVALLKFLSGYREWTLGRAKTTATLALSMSNLGVFSNKGLAETEGGKEWVVEQMLFSRSADATGAPLNITVASSDKGQLGLVYSWQPGALGVKDEKKFVQEIGATTLKLMDGL